MLSLLDNSSNPADLPFVQPMAHGETHFRLDPELRFPVRRLHVHMSAKLLPREEKEPEFSLPE
jgi:hypothetical protein